MLNKQTQKDYVMGNHDLFPNMYHIIDAQADSFKSKYKPKTDKMVQTIRYILKDMSTPYSSISSSDKPPSSPPDGSIHKPTPEPSEKATPHPSKKSNTCILRVDSCNTS